MAVGNLAQEAAVNLGFELKKWPSWVKEGGPAFAFSLFCKYLYVTTCFLKYFDTKPIPQSHHLDQHI